MYCADLVFDTGDDLQLNQDQPSNKSNQSTITSITTVDSTGGADADQSGAKWVVARVSVEVMSKQTSRGQIPDEENKVEEGGNYLCGAIEEEDCEDGEGGEGNGENGLQWVSIRGFVRAGSRRRRTYKDFRSDDLPRNPAETKVAELVHHITQCADEDDSEQELEEPDRPNGGFCYSSCDHLDKSTLRGAIWKKGVFGIKEKLARTERS